MVGVVWLIGAAGASAITPLFGQVPGSPFAADLGTNSVAFSPNGGVLAAANGDTYNVSVYTVGADGALTQVGTSPYGLGVGNVAFSVAFSPDGNLLAAGSEKGIFVFSVAPDGTLSEISGSPFGSGTASESVAFNSSGTLLASIDGIYSVSVFSVASGGALSPVTGSPFTTGGVPLSVAFSPDGSLLATADSAGNEVSVFSVASGGALSPVTGSPFTTGGVPLSVAFSPDGSLLATADSAGNEVSVFSVASGGALSPVTGSPFTTGNGPGSVAFSPDGSLLATSNAESNDVSVFSVGSSGNLTAAAGSPYPTGSGSGPAGLEFDPVGGLLATAEEGTSAVGVFSGVSTTASSPVPVVPVGQATSDSATVTGNSYSGSPTGSVSFYVCGPLGSAAGCAGTGDQVGGPIALTAGAGDSASARSAAFTPTSPGTWCFYAVYGGDGSYLGSSDSSANGCFTVTKAATATMSAPAAGSIVLGSSDSDTATVPGNATAGSPTGSVSFYVCGPLGSAAGCSSTGDQVGGPVALTAAGHAASASSVAFTPTSAGTWCFYAVYGGDGNYGGSSDSSSDGCFTVATPTTTTTTTSTPTTTPTPTATPALTFGNPMATIASPANGATYTIGQSVDSAYSCADSVDGTGIAACMGTVADGRPIDTATLGSHTFTVVALSRDGNMTTVTSVYTVKRPSNRFTVTGIRALAGGQVRFTVKLPGPGTLNVLETDWQDNLARTANAATVLQPAPKRFVFARVHFVKGSAGSFTVTVTPDRAALKVIEHPRYKIRVRLWVSYVPSPDGVQRNQGFRGILLRR